MSKELLTISIDLGAEKNEQCAVINLHYKGVDHIIYETHDKEQVEALNKIMEAENRKLSGSQYHNIIIDESIDNANPNEALETLKDMLIGNGVNDNINDYVDNLILPIKQALLKAEQDKKKLNEIEKLTYLLYSERRKIGQEYVKWCKENNILVSDETNMITWVLAIKLKEWLK